MNITKQYRVTVDWVVFRRKRYYRNDLIPVPDGKFRNAQEEEFLNANAKEIEMVSARVVSEDALTEQRVDDDDKHEQSKKRKRKKAVHKEEDMNDE